jgi:hypothetical protein
LENPRLCMEKLWYVRYSKDLGEEHDKKTIEIRVSNPIYFFIWNVMLIAFCKDSFYCANFISGVKKFMSKSITKLLSNVFISLICSLIINYS